MGVTVLFQAIVWYRVGKSDEDDTLVSDEPINCSTDINDETDSINETSEEDNETV